MEPQATPSPTADWLIRLCDEVALFRGFSAAELVSLLRACGQRVNFAAGHLVFREGAPGNAMYVILSGQVQISRSRGAKGEKVLATLGTGDTVGEMGLLDSSPRSAQARVTTDAVLLCLRSAVLDRVEPALAVKLYRNFGSIVAGRLRAANQQLMGLTEQTQALTERCKRLSARQVREGEKDYRGADLSEVDLSGAQLRGADLRGANASGARLRDADVRESDFRGSDLRACWFVDTNLSGADFTGADLRGAVFRGTNFEDANFARAQLAAAIVSQELGEHPVGLDD
jgi:CRP-like cAMP-binding protein